MKLLDVPQSGSLAGQTSSRNRFGQYRRTRAMPTQPRTSDQTSVRAILAGCAASWSALTVEEQLAWRAWSELHPRTDSLGQVIVMTGAQAFNAVNCMMVKFLGGAVAIPPADPLPEPPTITDGFLDDSPDGQINFAETEAGGSLVLFFGSPPRSLGSGFNGDFRFLGSSAGGATSPNTTALVPKWVDKFGSPVVGQRLFLRAKLLRSDGGCSAWSNTFLLDVEAA